MGKMNRAELLELNQRLVALNNVLGTSNQDLEWWRRLIDVDSEELLALCERAADVSSQGNIAAELRREVRNARSVLKRNAEPNLTAGKLPNAETVRVAVFALLGPLTHLQNEVNFGSPVSASPPTIPGDSAAVEYSFDVAFSFAGEQRAYVEKVAKLLQGKCNVFYDNFEQHDLWGKDLGAHLDTVYRKKSRFCVVFVSKEYAAKDWPVHEFRSALARAIGDRRDYILPVRMDTTDLPGLAPTVGFIDGRQTTPEVLASLVLKKLGHGPQLPPAVSRNAAYVIMARPRTSFMARRGEIHDALVQSKPYYRVEEERRPWPHCFNVDVSTRNGSFVWEARDRSGIQSLEAGSDSVLSYHREFITGPKDSFATTRFDALATDAICFLRLVAATYRSLREQRKSGDDIFDVTLELSGPTDEGGTVAMFTPHSPVRAVDHMRTARLARSPFVGSGFASAAACSADPDALAEVAIDLLNRAAEGFQLEKVLGARGGAPFLQLDTASLTWLIRDWFGSP